MGGFIVFTSLIIVVIPFRRPLLRHCAASHIFRVLLALIGFIFLIIIVAEIAIGVLCPVERGLCSTFGVESEVSEGGKHVFLVAWSVTHTSVKPRIILSVCLKHEGQAILNLLGGGLKIRAVTSG